MRILLTLVLLQIAGPSWADSPMTASEFEAYVTGRTLFYGQNAEVYGAEEYLSNRRVKWSFLDGDCKDGRWYPQNEQICFVYEDRPEPQCWVFHLREGGLSAQFQGNETQPELYEAQDLGDEMLCLGPRIGV